MYKNERKAYKCLKDEHFRLSLESENNRIKIRDLLN